MENYFDLGAYRRPISTQSATAQKWFDRGLNWCFAFHHEEAVHCFRRVVQADPRCAMGYWGLAYATGPYYNLRWEDYTPEELKQVLAETYHCIQTAAQYLEYASPVEQALIRALLKRYQSPDQPNDFTPWNDAYAAAMRPIYAAYPDDNDVCFLTADALMYRHPWKLWDLVHRQPTEGADTLEAIAIIDEALARIEAKGEPPHPGLLHLCIHVHEMSPTPENALPASDQLRYLMPDAGHVLHMPSHIYMLCGQYEKALKANTLAIEADQKYTAYNDELLGMFALSCCHQYQFKIHAGMMLGRFEPALEAANGMIDYIPIAGLLHEQAYLAHTLEGYYSMKVHALVRFGQWQMLIDTPLPEDRDLFLFTTAMWHYGKTLAYAALQDISKACREQGRFEAAVNRIPTDRLLFNNTCHDLLAVADAMLKGEVQYRQGNYTVAFEHLRHSVTLYDALLYTEPWAWMQPVRHALGALLLEQGHVEEAEQVYRADLGLDDTIVRPAQHPDNIWALLGYVECLERLGKQELLPPMQQKLTQAQAVADSNIGVSCFCRLGDGCC
ncbi:MAG: hypothetical protein AAF485_13875 [Chloroflexota bacterium]